VVFLTTPPSPTPKANSMAIWFQQPNTFSPRGGSPVSVPPPPGINIIYALDNIPINGPFLEILTNLPGTLTYSIPTNPNNLFGLIGNQVTVAGILTKGTTYNVTVSVTNGPQIQSASFQAKCINVAASWVPGIPPFAATSPYKTLIPSSGVTYTPIAWPTPGAYPDVYFANVKTYVDVPAADETTVCSFFGVSDFGGAPNQTINRIMTPGFNGAAAFVGDTIDNEMISMAATNALCCYYFTRISDTLATTSSFAGLGPVGDVLNASGFGILGGGQFGNNLAAGVVASGASNIMAPFKEEFTRTGAFSHLIMLTPPNSLTTMGFVAPAIFGDGSAVSGLFKTGQLLAIPKTTAMPAGLSAYGQAIFLAGQNYGVMPWDTGGGFGVDLNVVYDESNSGGGYPYAASTSWTPADVTLLGADLTLIIPLLQTVTI
jgi:hypothetical protein